MRRHLLVTNDFPPKVGGIQNYLWELWRRLDPRHVAVYCTPHPDADRFDAGQGFPIDRSRERFLLPYPWLPRRLRRLMTESGAELVLLDPALPLGLVGPFLRRPYGVVLHGAEVTIPARVPGLRSLMGFVLRNASLVVSAGQYALAEAERCVGGPLPGAVVAPGVDLERFSPPSVPARAVARRDLGLADAHFVVAVATRLVPRKGMHTLVDAAALLAADHPGLRVLIGGRGRQSRRLARLVERLDAPVTLLGRLTDDDVVRLYQAADLMVMPCNRRWWGLEQEGFGIVYLEAAACGVPQIAGQSGGAAEAVVDGETGLVLSRPEDPAQLAAGIARFIHDPVFTRSLGDQARRRVEQTFDYRHLADILQRAIDSAVLRAPVSASLTRRVPRRKRRNR